MKNARPNSQADKHPKRWSTWQTIHEESRRVSHVKWRGVKCKQNPHDAFVMQRLICESQPDVIIETGTLCGGSALFWIELLRDHSSTPRVITIDIDTFHRPVGYGWDGILPITGSSTADHTFMRVEDLLSAIRDDAGHELRVMVSLDSDHTPDHVLKEMELYGPLVTPGCWMVVQDTWRSYWLGRRDTVPRIHQYAEANGFEVNRDVEISDVLTYHPCGYLQKVEG